MIVDLRLRGEAYAIVILIEDNRHRLEERVTHNPSIEWHTILTYNGEDTFIAALTI